MSDTVSERTGRRSGRTGYQLVSPPPARTTGNAALLAEDTDTSSITIRLCAVREHAMKRTDISEEDEGKRVVNSAGKKIGIVKTVKNGRAYVDPSPGIADSIRSRLGWGDADEDDYELESRRIADISDDEVRLKP